ncbi:MAG: RHS repeat-associated core domain-containing protein [Fimbriimonadaceae bacterium]
MAMSMRVSNMGGRVIATKRAGVRSYHQHDALGNTIALINDSGVVTDTLTYSPYGELRTSTGTTTNPFKFCGAWGYYTDTTGRTYVRARTLRPGLMRWMTVDPLWPTEVSYGYCKSNPSTDIDPYGTCVLETGRTWKNQGWCRKGTSDILPGQTNGPSRRNTPHPDPCKECNIPKDCCWPGGSFHRYLTIDIIQMFTGSAYHGSICVNQGYSPPNPCGPKFVTDPSSYAYAIIEMISIGGIGIGGAFNQLVAGLKSTGCIRWTLKDDSFPLPKWLKCKSREFKLHFEVTTDFFCLRDRCKEQAVCNQPFPDPPNYSPGAVDNPGKSNQRIH